MAFKRVLTWMGDKFLSDETKRVILISSLLGCIEERRHLEDQYLQLLNERLSLVKNPAELKFPMLAAQGIWPPECINRIKDLSQFKDEDMRAVAGTLLNMIPGWLSYNNKSAIMEDIAQVLHFEKTIGPTIAHQ